MVDFIDVVDVVFFRSKRTYCCCVINMVNTFGGVDVVVVDVVVVIIVVNVVVHLFICLLILISFYLALQIFLYHHLW